LLRQPLRLTIAIAARRREKKHCEPADRRRLAPPQARERGAMSAQSAVAASTSQLAMGRIVGSLCVVTARDEDAASAMLVRRGAGGGRRRPARGSSAPVPGGFVAAAARPPPPPPLSPACASSLPAALRVVLRPLSPQPPSLPPFLPCPPARGARGRPPPPQASWVSQASFDPPGLTLAVKKDRGMESLLTPGKKFAMSMLAEGRFKPAMKAGGWDGGRGGRGQGANGEGKGVGMGRRRPRCAPASTEPPSPPRARREAGAPLASSPPAPRPSCARAPTPGA
jgi:hypothetical protein